jgi:hypothetical protein
VREGRDPDESAGVPGGGPKCKVAGCDSRGRRCERWSGRGTCSQSLGEAGRGVALPRPAPAPRTCASHRRRGGGVPWCWGPLMLALRPCH